MLGTDLGTVGLGATLVAPLPILNSALAPKDPAVLPTYRVYGSGPDPMPSGTGSLAKLDTGVITGATNATPIVITSAGHGITTGTRIVCSSVAGNSAANGEFTATRINDNTFSLDGSTGSGVYTSGGTFHVAGLYAISLQVLAGSGYEAGQGYFVHVSWAIAPDSYVMVCPFRVV